MRVSRQSRASVVRFDDRGDCGEVRRRRRAYQGECVLKTKELVLERLCACECSLSVGRTYSRRMSDKAPQCCKPKEVCDVTRRKIVTSRQTLALIAACSPFHLLDDHPGSLALIKDPTRSCYYTG